MFRASYGYLINVHVSSNQGRFLQLLSISPRQRCPEVNELSVYFTKVVIMQNEDFKLQDCHHAEALKSVTVASYVLH